MLCPLESKKITIIDKKDDYNEEIVWESWPSLCGRPVDGGISDLPIKEHFNNVKMPERFYMRTDGSTIFESSAPFTILTECGETTVNTNVPIDKAILIPAYVPYSAPYLRPCDKEKGFDVWSRKTGKVFESSFLKSNKILDTMKLSSNFCDKELILSKDIPSGVEVIHYPSLVMDKATFTNTDGQEIDMVTPLNWPLCPQIKSSVGILKQEFTMEWVDEGDVLEILFKGLSGSLAGSEGRPGVIFNKLNNTITVKVLLSRPDGSFLIGTEGSMCMITARPDNNGEPNHQTLRAVKYTSGVKLPAGWWHSVPFPMPNVPKILLCEQVAETNANIIINVIEEVGRPITLKMTGCD